MWRDAFLLDQPAEHSNRRWVKTKRLTPGCVKTLPLL
jgi:hypothetical protein